MPVQWKFFFAGAWDVECSNLSEEVVSDGHTVVAPGFCFVWKIFGLEVLKTFDPDRIMFSVLQLGIRCGSGRTGNLPKSMDSGALENTKMGIFFEGSHERCRWLEERENGNITLVKEEEVPLIGWA